MPIFAIISCFGASADYQYTKFSTCKKIWLYCMHAIYMCHKYILKYLKNIYTWLTPAHDICLLLQLFSFSLSEDLRTLSSFCMPWLG